MTRADLIAELDAYLSRTGMTEFEFGRKVFNDGCRVEALRRGVRFRNGTTGRVRRFIAENPPPALTDDPPAPVAEAVKQEAELAGEVRKRARMIGGMHNVVDGKRDPVTEFLAQAMEPGAAVQLVRERWPELWRRIVEASRGLGVGPAVLMVRLIEAGMEAQA